LSTVWFRPRIVHRIITFLSVNVMIIVLKRRNQLKRVVSFIGQYVRNNFIYYVICCRIKCWKLIFCVSFSCDTSVSVFVNWFGKITIFLSRVYTHVEPFIFLKFIIRQSILSDKRLDFSSRRNSAIYFIYYREYDSWSCKWYYIIVFAGNLRFVWIQHCLDWFD
jgi:hypothetical protein